MKKDNFLTLKDMVELDSLLEDDDKEQLLKQCLMVIDKIDLVEDANIHFYQGVSLEVSDQQLEAITYYNECLKLNSSHIECLSRLASIYEEQKEYNNAIQCLENVIQITPQDEQKYFQLGGIYRKMNKYDKAIKIYKICLKLNPNKLFLYYYLGIAYRQNNNLQMAILNYKKYLKYYPNDANCLYNISLAYFHKKKYQKSIYYLMNIKQNTQLDESVQQLLQSIWEQIQVDKSFRST